MDKLQHDGILQPTHDESLEKCKSCIYVKMERKPFPHQVERAKDLLGLIHTDLAFSIWFQPRRLKGRLMKYGMGKLIKFAYLRVWGCEALVKQDAPEKLDPRSIKCIFIGYLKETMGYYFYYPRENKIFVARNAEFFENNLIVQEARGSHGLLKSSVTGEGLELIQEEDTQPSENTSKEHNEVAPTKEHELGILMNLLITRLHYQIPEFDKWLEAMNTEIFESLKVLTSALQSKEVETKKDEDTHATSHDVPKDTSVPHPPSPKSAQIQELMAQVHLLQSQKDKLEHQKAKAEAEGMEIELPGDLNDIPTKLETFTSTASSLMSQVAELKTLKWELPAEFLALPS
ncbi:retrotransposon protein, putative, ty1-copia subclass [Tanacetum coccineum]